MAFSKYLNFRNIVTYFLRWSVGNLISFCIRTLIISPGVPTSPPQAPAPAAIATLWKNDIGSPFGLTYFFAVWKRRQLKLKTPLKVSQSRKQILNLSFEPKNQRKYFCISALASKSGRIKKKQDQYVYDKYQTLN